jgi:hypothetical protein
VSNKRAISQSAKQPTSTSTIMARLGKMGGRGGGIKRTKLSGSKGPA